MTRNSVVGVDPSEDLGRGDVPRRKPNIYMSTLEVSI